MKSFGLIGAGVLLLLFGMAAPISAQQAHEGKPRHQEPRGKAGERKEQRHQHDQSARRVEQGEQGNLWRGQRAHSWQSEHRTWQQRGGYRGYRIPEDHFRGYFGQNHWFRIYNVPVVIIGRYPRFQYGGYWFRPVDPWPEDWADTWYQDDDVYIDYYQDGYYLYNRHHPGIRIAVRVYVP